MMCTKRKLFAEPLMSSHQTKSLPIKKRKLRIDIASKCQVLPGIQSQFIPGFSDVLHPSCNQAAIDQRKGFIETFKQSVKDDIFALLYMNAQCLPRRVQANESPLKSTCKEIKSQTHASQPQESTIFDEMWQERYNELVVFWKQNGHSCVPQRYPPNRALGKWVHKQRQEYKKRRNGLTSSLTSYRIESLVKLQFQFDPTNRAEGLWQRRYKELIHFRELHGHCMVPQKYPPNRALGKWVHRQRHEFSKEINKESSFLTRKRIDALNKIGFQWFSSRSKLNEKQSVCWTKNESTASLCEKAALEQLRHRECLNVYNSKPFSNKVERRQCTNSFIPPKLYVAASSA